MKILDGIRVLAFIAMLFSVFFAYIHHGFLRQYPHDSQFERWLTQRNDYLLAAAIALGIVLLCSFAIWLVEKTRKKRKQQKRDLIVETEKRVHAERDSRDKTNERNARQIQERWNQELNPTE